MHILRYIRYITTIIIFGIFIIKSLNFAENLLDKIQLNPTESIVLHHGDKLRVTSESYVFIIAESEEFFILDAIENEQYITAFGIIDENVFVSDMLVKNADVYVSSFQSVRLVFVSEESLQQIIKIKTKIFVQIIAGIFLIYSAAVIVWFTSMIAISILEFQISGNKVWEDTDEDEKNRFRQWRSKS